MRTKEKFYENLNKKHVSLEKKIERFEFQDVKTLDALLSQSKSLNSKIKEQASKSIKAMIEKMKLEKIEKKMEEEYKDQEQKEKDVTARFTKLREEASKDRINAFKVFQKAVSEFDEADAIRKVEESNLNKLTNEGKQLVKRFYDNIKQFESSARALGIDVSGKTNKYKSAAETLREQAD